MKKIATAFSALVLAMASATLTGCGLFGDNGGDGKKEETTAARFSQPLNAKPVAASENGGELVVLDSLTDGENNYYLIDTGYIKDMYISTLAMVDYTGLPISFSKTTTTSSSYLSSITKSVSESITVSNSQSYKVGIGVAWESKEFKVGKFSVNGNFEWNGTWTNSTGTSKSTTDTVESASKFEESQTISYSFGNDTASIGRYRYATYGTCDIYFIVKTSLDNSELLAFDTSACARESEYFLRSEYSATGEFDNTPLGEINIRDDFYKRLPIPTESGKIEPTGELTVYENTIRTGTTKIAGSGKYTLDTFTINKTLAELRDLGYSQLKFDISYDLKEVDDCKQFVSLFTSTNKMIREETTYHGGGNKDTNWGTHKMSCSVLLSEIDSEIFNFRCQAENKIFKDFYIGTVVVKVTAV